MKFRRCDNHYATPRTKCTPLGHHWAEKKNTISTQYHPFSTILFESNNVSFRWWKKDSSDNRPYYKRAWDSYDSEAVNNCSHTSSHAVHRTKNTVILPNFLVWKFCGKAQFPHSFGRFTWNYVETVPFHKISTPRN